MAVKLHRCRRLGRDDARLLSDSEILAADPSWQPEDLRGPV